MGNGEEEEATRMAKDTVSGQECTVIVRKAP